MSQQHKPGGQRVRPQSTQDRPQARIDTPKEASPGTRGNEEAMLAGVGTQFDLRDIGSRGADILKEVFDSTDRHDPLIDVASLALLHQQPSQSHEKETMNRWLSSPDDFVQYKRSSIIWRRCHSHIEAAESVIGDGDKRQLAVEWERPTAGVRCVRVRRVVEGAGNQFEQRVASESGDGQAASKQYPRSLENKNAPYSDPTGSSSLLLLESKIRRAKSQVPETQGEPSKRPVALQRWLSQNQDFPEYWHSHGGSEEQSIVRSVEDREKEDEERQRRHKELSEYPQGPDN
ncbi:hypothetical protein M409DRAFT_57578 [Zasmidium cellare ATCC 36951]|uniref:Uncharacterized protein n=1 Tax=Zasmidium cellare ATCC 36951 TaxID=1080233 RepID=A0A6A6CAM9_ZASCE|nr:uncharacterized protein M409DRAFT_57578 [Zasmidium cellare ATCC 36951]KAF2163288.1 hypothetical protein M409DRAFT_57578 [Zasmidium cellare ATCC 36951]